MSVCVHTGTLINILGILVFRLLVRLWGGRTFSSFLFKMEMFQRGWSLGQTGLLLSSHNERLNWCDCYLLCTLSFEKAGIWNTHHLCPFMVQHDEAAVASLPSSPKSNQYPVLNHSSGSALASWSAVLSHSSLGYESTAHNKQQPTSELRCPLRAVQRQYKCSEYPL